MIKITQFHDTDKPDPNHLLIATDVSSRQLDFYGRYKQGGVEYELVESVFNELATINERLDYYGKHARGLGYSGLAFVVEPSGCYEKKLTLTALKRGFSVWTVNPERIYKAGVIHHGDDGKSDPLDGKVLYMMARMGNASQLVPLPADWQNLRQLGQWMEDCTLAAADARIHIGVVRRQLFVDYRQSGDLTWGPTGQAIQHLYGFDPWQITAKPYEVYLARIRAHQKGIPERCLASIWRQAKESCRAMLSPQQQRVCREQLDHLWHIWKWHTARRESLGREMICIVDQLEPNYWIPPVISGFTELMRAKILAETGPLEQFPHWRALLAFAGIKVRMRSSGKYRGQDKITKKGRVLLRKHLGQAAFVLARKDRILGPYYHRKIKEGMPARKAKVACMRKLVKMIYGAAKSQQEFTKQRVYQSAG